MDRIQRNQRNCRRSLQSLMDEWSKIKDTEESSKMNQLTYFQAEITEMLVKLKEIDESILETIEDEMYDAEFDKCMETQQNAKRIIHDIATRLSMDKTSKEIIDSSGDARNTQLATKLPQIDLPKFGGKYSDWTSFQDQFNTAIHDNCKLSNVQKLIYLKRSLNADAEKMIKNLATTDENYEIARNILKDRYQNDRLILRNHLCKLTEFKPVRSENIAQLKLLHSTFLETSQSMTAIGIEIDNHFAHHLLFQNMDPESQKEWEMKNQGSNHLNFNDLMRFLDNRVRAFEMCNNQSDQTRKRQSETINTFDQQSRYSKCSIAQCQENHPIWNCETFKNMDPDSKKNTIAKAKLCYNCFRSNHRVAECKSTSTCRTCKQKHHSLLHDCFQNVANVNSIEKETDIAGIATCFGSVNTMNKTTVLPTAKTTIIGKMGRIKLKTLIDTGAHANAITRNACTKLGLKPKKSTASIIGVGQCNPKPVDGVVNIKIMQIDGKIIEAECLVLETITAMENPRYQVQVAEIEKLKNYVLADPDFGTPGNIELLLGVAVHAQIVKSNIRTIGNLCLTDTKLGWIVSGLAETFRNEQLPYEINFIQQTQNPFMKFWEIEDVPTLRTAKYNKDELECIEHYDATTFRDSDGRYCVNLPFDKKTCRVEPDSGKLIPNIGHNQQKALRQFINNERRLEMEPAAKIQYNDFFKEMMDMGHLEKVPQEHMNLAAGKYYILQHHAVMKPDSTTTKCRAVFNGSAKTSNGKSLNDHLLVGPKQQPELYEILIKFRFLKVALTGDVTKMYRQIKLNEQDRNYHQIYWRNDSSQPIDRYRLTVVIYGISSSSYHAIRALRDSVEFAKKPATKIAIQESFFVDDFLGGGDNEEEVKNLRRDITDTLDKIGMQIRKWASNSKDVMTDIPEKLHENQDLFINDHDHILKTLGMHWSPVQDAFIFKCIQKMPQPLSIEDDESDILVKFDTILEHESKNIKAAKIAENDQNNCPNNLNKKQKGSRKTEVKNSSDVVNFEAIKNNLQNIETEQPIAHSKENTCPMKIQKIINGTTMFGQLQRPSKTGQSENFDINLVSIDREKVPDYFKKFTRRILSSHLGRIFDPIGLLTPITILPKTLFQRTWDDEKFGWDDNLDENIKDEFCLWLSQLESLKSLKIPRFLAQLKIEQCQLHLFCDASEIAYGCAIYARTIQNGKIHTNLVTAKSRLAPRKTKSIAKLELCSMVLGVKLLKTVLNAIKSLNKTIECFAWGDSTIALCWIRSMPNRYSVFVANRIAKIQDEFPKEIWKHVPTSSNPADHATRPVSPRDLEQLSIWWHGPTWLRTEPLEVPQQPEILETEETRKEMKKKDTAIHVIGFQAAKSGYILPMERWGTLEKSLRIATLIIKVKRIIMKQTSDDEMLRKEAMILLVKDVQRQHFQREIEDLQKENKVNKTSRIVGLYPFLDEDGTIKVGGRITAAENIPQEMKFQYIIPSKVHFAKLIVDQCHRKVMHSGLNTTLAKTRETFWILHGRELTRHLIRNCTKCFRFNSKPSTQLMGDLPSERINPSKPFSHTGIDFTGPLLVKDGKLLKKIYCVIFVCFCTKAVHLDLCDSLNAQDCIKAIRRFIARRGCPEKIYTDNATNFEGARNELQKINQLIAAKDSNSLFKMLGSMNIQWLTIPPRAPNFGGLWEAAVKSMKLLLRKEIGVAKLTAEELYTIVCQVESILNSRPLTPLSDDVKDPTPLTPAMMLTGFNQSQVTIMPQRCTKLNVNEPIIRWNYLQKLINAFWKRWTKEYVTSLQIRCKNKIEVKNLKIGDLVFVTEDDTPPLIWPIGRIIEVYDGNDKLIRVVKIQLPKGNIIIRPITKIRKIPVET